MIYWNDDIARFDWQAALPLLSEQRREQVLRYRHELGRRQSAAAYLLLCDALRREYGMDLRPTFAYGPHGKPTLVELPHLHFSLSHCREAVCCAVSEQPIGIDVEMVGRYRPSLARYTMNPRELEQIDASPQPDVEFTRLWTRKEAVVKRSGQGIQGNLKHVLDGIPVDAIHTEVSRDARYVWSVI